MPGNRKNAKAPTCQKKNAMNKGLHLKTKKLAMTWPHIGTECLF